MSANSAWEIPTLNIEDDFGNEKFTIFNPNNVFFEEDDQAGLKQKKIALKRNYKELVIFKPVRLLLHAIIVGFSLKFKRSIPGKSNEDEERDWYDLIQHTHQTLMTTPEIEQRLDRWGQQLKEKEDPEEDKIENEIMGTTMKILDIIAPNLKEMKTIEIPNPEERLTFMVVGGQASGKSGAVERFKREVRDWNDVVLVNTDRYKPLLLDYDREQHGYLWSQYTQSEASLIHQKIFLELQKLANERKAPHVLFDQVYLGSDKLNFSQIEGGRALVTLVSTDVDEAMKRSFHRGENARIKPATRHRIPRYEEAGSILKGHKGMWIDFGRTLSKFVGGNIQVSLCDNNAGLAQIGELNMSHEPPIQIGNKKSFLRLNKKSRINSDAKQENDMYNHKSHFEAFITTFAFEEDNGRFLTR